MINKKSLIIPSFFVIIILIILFFKSSNLKPLGFAAKNPSSEEQMKSAFNYINELRVKYNRTKLSWDNNTYNFAIERARDMFLRKYSDHITPEGRCVNDFKVDYGFNSTEFIAENIGFMPHYFNGEPVFNANLNQVVNDWMKSRGHKYNLLYSEHKKGAIGCYKYICVFLGIHNNRYGLGTKCVKVSESNKFWRTAAVQLGEI